MPISSTYSLSNPLQLLFASGFLFMGATEEQMEFVSHSGLDHVAYILILFSLSFLLFLFANMLITLYDRTANAPGLAKNTVNGRARSGTATQEDGRLRDANEFELEGLVSDDEDEEHASRRKLLRDDGVEEDGGLASPSTVGRNSDRVA